MPRRLAVLAALTATLLLLAVPAPAQEAPEGGGPLTGVRSTSTGNYHSCAAVAGGQARCWGSGANGQLGRGSTNDALRAVTVRNASNTGPLTGVVDVATGYQHSCALLSSGQVRCWGVGGDGALGNGTTNQRLLPRPVLAPSGPGRLTGVTQISTSGRHTCARLSNGQARCWGDNFHGQLGTGNTTDRLRPAVVRRVSGAGPLTGITTIDTSLTHTCARLSNGQARCWGDNDSGALGDDTTDDRSRPVVVRNVAGTGPLVGVRRISAGEFHTCAALNNFEARCWGDNDQLRLGNGSSFDTQRPGIVVGEGSTGRLELVVAIEAGTRSTCALLNIGQVRCWGDNEYGQLGDGNAGSTNYPYPVPVRNVADSASLSDASQLDAMSFTFCVRLSNEARCWGYGELGNLGNGTETSSDLPVKVLA